MTKIKKSEKINNLSKKAQISLFVILGIIIIAGILIYYFIPRDSELIDTSRTTEQEAPEVARYVEDCISLLGIEAFKKIGENGGYLNMSFTKEKLILNEDETESDILKFSQSELPYWWYLKTSNGCSNCQLGSNIPSLELIEFQVEQHVQDNMDECLKNFKEFQTAGINVEHGKTTADVKINSNDVEIKVNIPVKVTGAEEANLNEFRKTLDLRFKKIYNLAFNITQTEAETQFLENATLGYIGIYGAADSSKIPPITWIDHSPSSVFWSTSDVKTKIQSSIVPNVVLTQIDKTKDAKKITRTEYDNIYNVMYIKNIVKDDSYKDVSVNFVYDPAWDIYLKIIPNSGGLLKASNYRVDFPMGNLPSFYTNIYEFFYDVSYPVAVVIHDDKSLNRYENDGYNFIFSMESNIRGNKNMFQWRTGNGAVIFDNVNEAEIAEQETEFGTCTEVSGKFRCSLNTLIYDDFAKCGNGCKKEKVVKTKLSVSKSLFCNPNQKISKELTLELKDDSGQPINNAIVYYGCGRYKDCTMGITKDGKFSSKMPICIGGGYLKIEKEGHPVKFVNDITTDLNNPVSLSVAMNTITQAKVKIKVIQLINVFRFKKELEGDAQKLQQISNEIKLKIDLLPINSTQKLKLKNRISSDLDLPATQATLELVGMEYSYQVSDDSVINSAKGLESAFAKISDMTSKGYVKRVLNLTTTQTSGFSIPGFLNPNDNLENLTLNISEASKQDALSIIESINKKLKNLRLRTPANDYGKQTYLNDAREMKVTENGALIIADLAGKFSRTENNMSKSGASIDIIPGNYNVQIFMTDKSLGSINVIGGNLIPLNQLNIGSALLDANTGLWKVNSNPSQITFYVLRVETPSDINEFDEIAKVEAYSSRFRDVIEPEVG